MNPDQSFRERVQALVAEGKLTPQEAEALLGGDTTSPEPQAPPVPPVPVIPDLPEPPAPPMLPDSEQTPVYLDRHGEVGEPTDVPPVLHLIASAFNLTVRIDPQVSAPRLYVSVPDRVHLVGTPEGWLVKRVGSKWKDRSEGWLDRLVGGVIEEGHLRAELVVPPGIREVNAKVQGGSLVLPDLTAPVHVKVQGGNLTVGNASELHAKVQGGNLRWTATVSGGEHHVKVQGGNANVQLQPGSSLRLEGEVMAGNMSTSGFQVTKKSRDYVNSSYTGVLADGRAHLAFKVQGGNMKVVAS